MVLKNLLGLLFAKEDEAVKEAFYYWNGERYIVQLTLKKPLVKHFVCSAVGSVETFEEGDELIHVHAFPRDYPKESNWINWILRNYAVVNHRRVKLREIEKPTSYMIRGLEIIKERNIKRCDVPGCKELAKYRFEKVTLITSNSKCGYFAYSCENPEHYRQVKEMPGSTREVREIDPFKW